jgi:hypothetical protein
LYRYPDPDANTVHNSNSNTVANANANADAGGAGAKFVAVAGDRFGNAQRWCTTQVSEVKDLQRRFSRKGGVIK